MHPIKRPKAGETEEDLLKQEKEFLASVKQQNFTPAAKLVRMGGHPEVTSGSKGLEEKEKDCNMEVEDEVNRNSGDVVIENPTDVVLLRVVEKPFDPSKLKDSYGSQAPVKATRLLGGARHDTGGGESGEGSSGRKKSLFAKSFDARKQAQKKQDGQNLEGSGPRCETAGAVHESTKPKKAIGDQIHPLLAGMTEEEILDEQRKLLERLDPKLVEFIRKRKHQSQVSSEQVMDTTTSAPKPQKNVSLLSNEELPINPVDVKSFPGMEKIEHAKLAWAGTVPERSLDNAQPVDGKSARFDFQGHLLSDSLSNDPTTYNRALHNHGEEMDRPGYTVEELLTLSRSANMQQRSIALETLGNIYAHAHRGVYDDVLENTIFNLFDYMDFIYTIRKGLDDENAGSINSALNCLASLLYPEQEEICLDSTYLWPGARPFPLLVTISAEDIPGDKDLKDFEYLQLDLLDFLIKRTDILSRIQYILMAKSGVLYEQGVISILKILIRLSRHSPANVMQHEKILKYITEHHITPNWFKLGERDKALKGVPLVHALKCVRVLSESSPTNAMKIYSSYSVLPSVLSYLAYDQWKEQTHVQDVEDLVLESFRIWLALLRAQVAIDEYVAFFPVVMQFLRFYSLADTLNSFDLYHSAHLFALLTEIIGFGDRNDLHSHWDLVKDAASLIEQYCVKILTILTNSPLEQTYNLDIALLSLGKGLEFLSLSMKYSRKAVATRMKFVLKNFIKSSTYVNLTKCLISHSCLLGRESTDLPKYPSNFSTLDAVKWRGELSPAVKSRSPFHFIANLIVFTKSMEEMSVNEMLYNSDIANYLKKLEPFQKTVDRLEYFVRFELNCLNEILSILPKTSSVRFPVAYKLLAEVPRCCSILFQNILRVVLETCCDESDVEAVYQFYLACFMPNSSLQSSSETIFKERDTKVRFSDGGQPGDGREEEHKILFQLWSSKLVETHWIFHPLENLYNRVNSSPGYVKNNMDLLELETRGCLSFIRQCLGYYCDVIIQTPQDLVTVYCRICRTFMLGSPGVYIDAQTTPILKDILITLIKGKVLNASCGTIFSKLKPSSKAAVSFFDFYSELVREYFDNSYFNEVFAAYLFLPLRSEEDSKVKSYFWNHELLHCVRLFTDKMPIPVEYLTRSPEKDPVILRLFTGLLKRSVVAQERSPFLYEVVVTHLKNSEEYMTDELRQDFSLLRV